MSFLINFNRLCFKTLQINSTRTIFTSHNLGIQRTPILYAEPLKKKKKLDPQIIKQREERKKKKIEKQIRRLEKNARQLKPIDELEVPLNLLDEKKQRQRININITTEMQEERDLLQKAWARYKHKEKVADYQLLDRMIRSQQKALKELRLESEELYREATQPDINLLPFCAKGPVATPPVNKYESPDGEYIDSSKKWD